MNNFIQVFEKYNLDFHGVRLPKVEVDQDVKKQLGLPDNVDNYTILNSLCQKGLKIKIKSGKLDIKKIEVYNNRCQTELEVFKKHNIVDYVLLIYDILSWCDKNDIPRGIARGSASGSLVFYLIGCNKIDPILHNLPFTRFISEARLQSKIVDGIVYLAGKSMPDYDGDVSYIRRGELIAYIDKKYKGKTSKIGTKITLTGKILIKECCKSYLEYSEEQSQEISNLIERHFGKVEELASAYKNSIEFKQWVDSSPENSKCYKIACSLESLTKARGQHPSGIAISYEDIDTICPLDLSSSKEPVSGYEMTDMAELMVKCDILGLKNTDINDAVCKSINLNIEDIDINSREIYDYYKNTDNFFGLFQIEDGLTKDTVVQVKPKNIDELACCVSLSRPGTYKDIPKYVDYIHNNNLESIYPIIDSVLKSTANILLYQEQVTQICSEIYGFTEIDADQVRYCIGKKKKDEMAKWEPILFQKGEEKNIPKDVTQKIWNTIVASADYQFSKNHAYSYSYLTAINTFLKNKYPLNFFLALLNMAKNEPDTNEIIGQITKELPFFNIKLLSPHILRSDIETKIENNNLRMGLSLIKGISNKSIEKLQNFKNQYSNKWDIYMAAEQSKIGSGIFQSLIMAGSMDDMLTESRSKTLLEWKLWKELTVKEKKYAKELGLKFNYNLFDLVKSLNTTIKDDKGRPIVKDSRKQTLNKHLGPHWKMFKQNDKNIDLCSYIMEGWLLGFSYSTTLKKIFSKFCNDLVDIQEIKQSLENDHVHFAAEVIEVKKGRSREKKTEYMKISCKDNTGSLDVLLFNTSKRQTIDECCENNGRAPVSGDIVIIKGNKKNDAVFARNVSIQDISIYRKISEIPKNEEITEKD